MDPKQFTIPYKGEQLTESKGFRVTVLSSFEGMLSQHRMLLSHAREKAGQDPSQVLVVMCYNDFSGGKVEAGQRVLLSPEERALLLTDMGYHHILPWRLPRDARHKTLEWPVNPELLKKKGGCLLPGADLWSQTAFKKLFKETAKADSHFLQQTDQSFAETDPGNKKLQQLTGLVESGALTEAAREMGFAYPLSGYVVEGNKIGRTLGYPTANLRLTDHSKVLPGQGAYAGMVNVAGDWHYSMINIGIRPTIDAENVTIEAHLFNFNDDIYGEYATFTFLGRIRDEMRFSSLADLKHQLDKDRHQSANILQYFARGSKERSFIFMQDRIKWS